MAIVPPDDRLIPVIDGKPLTGVVSYTFRAGVDEVATLDVQLAADWVPPFEAVQLCFGVGDWSQQARDALRRSLDEADSNAK